MAQADCAALRLVIGFSPGSASDIVAAVLAPALAEQLGEPVVIERQQGDNGALASRSVADAAADGRTLLIATLGTHAIAPNLYAALNYDPLRDFAPVALVACCPLLLAAHPALPVATAADLVEHARVRPGELAFGTSAIGGAPHLAAELFQRRTGVQLRHARYDDTRLLYEDLVAGRIALSFNNVMSMLPLVAGGKLRGLAVTSAQRCVLAPDLPTLAECGIAGATMENWLGIVAPAHTGAAVVARLNAAIVAALSADAARRGLLQQGMAPGGGSPADFANHLRDELAKWAPVVRQCMRAEAG